MAEARAASSTADLPAAIAAQLPVEQQLQSGSLRALPELRTYSWYSMPIALALATLFLLRMQLCEEFWQVANCDKATLVQVLEDGPRKHHSGMAI